MCIDSSLYLRFGISLKNNNENLSVGVVQVRGSKNDYPAHRRFQVAMTHPICNSSTQEAMIGDPLSKVAS